MNDKDRDVLLESQKREISRLQKDLSAERRELYRAKEEASESIRRIEKEYQDQISEMEWKKIDSLHSKGAISYFEDRRCATCDFFDCARSCVIESYERPLIKCTSGFCQANETRKGEVSPAAGCSKWQRWSEIDASLKAIAQKKREEKDRVEKLLALSSANAKYERTVSRNNLFIAIPVVILILSILVLGAIGWYKYEFFYLYSEELMNYATEHEWDDASKYISRYEQNKQDFKSFLIFSGIYGVVFAGGFSLCIYARSKRLKQIKESQPNPSDYGFEKKEE